MSSKIYIHLKRSPIGTTPDQRKNLLGLGLMRRGNYRVIDDTASNRGMIRKVIHLVEVSNKPLEKAPKTKKVSFEIIPGDVATGTEKKAKKSVSKVAQEKSAGKKTTKKTAKK